MILFNKKSVRNCTAFHIFLYFYLNLLLIFQNLAVYNETQFVMHQRNCVATYKRNLSERRENYSRALFTSIKKSVVQGFYKTVTKNGTP